MTGIWSQETSIYRRKRLVPSTGDQKLRPQAIKILNKLGKCPLPYVPHIQAGRQAGTPKLNSIFVCMLKHSINYKLCKMANLKT